MCSTLGCSVFFFNDTATTEIYTLSLHDALPISLPLLRRLPPRVLDGGAAAGAAGGVRRAPADRRHGRRRRARHRRGRRADRKSTRLNSSHANISYAVFCLKKKIKL